MKSLTVFAVSTLLAIQAHAQDTLWTRVYGGPQSDLTAHLGRSADGGYTIVGTTYSYGAGIPDSANVWLFHADSTGDSLWSRAYGGTRSEGGWGLDVLSDGYAVAGGADMSETDTPDNDGLLLRASLDGDSLWSRTYRAYGNQYFYQVRQTNDGGYIMTGITDWPRSIWTKLWLVRTDAAGDTLWTRTYGLEADCWGIDLRPAVDGGYAVLGSYNDTTVGEPWSAQYWLLRINDDGDTLWTQRYGDSRYEQPIAMDVTSDGGYLLGGTTEALGPNMDYYVVRTNAGGDTLWTREYGGTESDWCGILIAMPDDGFIASGSANFQNGSGYDFWVVRGNASGNMLWNRTYARPGWDEPHGACLTPDGNPVLSGWTQSPASAYDLWMMRIDPQAPNLQVVAPNGGEQWTVFTTDTVRWISDNSDGPVRLELNRHYPSGAWEVLADSTEDNNLRSVYATGPASSQCRVRFTVLSSGISDVSDADFSIAPSAGALHLVYPGNPQTPLSLWFAGTMTEPDTFSETFRLKNFGSAPLILFRPLDPSSDAFSAATTCDDSLILSPQQMSECELTLSYHPQTGGTHRDTLLILTNAANGDADGLFRLPLMGELLTSASRVASLPVSFALHPSYPNPFNSSTEIGFDLPKAGPVKITVYNLAGERVATLVDGPHAAGRYTVKFDGSTLASGVYVCRLETGAFMGQHKVVLLK